MRMAGRASSIDDGKETLLEVLKSGAGLRKLREFIANQGGDTAFIDDPSLLELAPVQLDLLAQADGWVERIDLPRQSDGHRWRSALGAR